jgi:hypothetical protein
MDELVAVIKEVQNDNLKIVYDVANAPISVKIP